MKTIIISNFETDVIFDSLHDKWHKLDNEILSNNISAARKIEILQQKDIIKILMYRITKK